MCHCSEQLQRISRASWTVTTQHRFHRYAFFPDAFTYSSTITSLSIIVIDERWCGGEMSFNLASTKSSTNARLSIYKANI